MMPCFGRPKTQQRCSKYCLVARVFTVPKTQRIKMRKTPIVAQIHEYCCNVNATPLPLEKYHKCNIFVIICIADKLVPPPL
jgi:hypothetical protein